MVRRACSSMHHRSRASWVATMVAPSEDDAAERAAARRNEGEGRGVASGMFVVRRMVWGA